MDATQLDRFLGAAERKIQAILLDLVNEHGITIDGVEVSTRQFDNLAVTIFADRSKISE